MSDRTPLFKRASRRLEALRSKIVTSVDDVKVLAYPSGLDFSGEGDADEWLDIVDIDHALEALARLDEERETFQAGFRRGLAEGLPGSAPVESREPDAWTCGGPYLDHFAGQWVKKPLDDEHVWLPVWIGLAPSERSGAREAEVDDRTALHDWLRECRRDSYEPGAEHIMEWCRKRFGGRVMAEIRAALTRHEAGGTREAMDLLREALAVSPQTSPDPVNAVAVVQDLVEAAVRALQSSAPSAAPVDREPAGDGAVGETERPEIVCLCGSTRFYREYQIANYEETMKGAIVLSVGFYPHSEEHHETVGLTNAGYPTSKKEELDELHLRKIDLADRVVVICPGGYIGESTAREITYAKSLGKPVERDERPAPDPEPVEGETERTPCPFCSRLLTEPGAKEFMLDYLRKRSGETEALREALEEAGEVIDEHLNHLYQVNVKVTRTAKRIRRALTRTTPEKEDENG